METKNYGGGRSGFTLVEIMIVVAIIAILAAIAIPELIESRKMSRLNKCMNNLKIISYAMEQTALNRGTASGQACDYDATISFLKDGVPTCPSVGISYDWGNLGVAPSCNYHGTIAEPTPLADLTSD